MLAVQTAPAERRPPRLSRALSRLMAPRERPAYAPVLLQGDDLAGAGSTPEAAETALDLGPADLAEETVAQAPEPPALEPIPPQILLGGLAPRRSAFGQRSDPVLELMEPVAPAPRRLMLMASDGAPVGEIIIHANDAPVIPPRRPLMTLETETPYFPEDLADEPRAPVAPAPAPRRSPGMPEAARPRRALKAGGPARPDAPAGSELAATFLLADLAARLASEEAALQDRLRRAAA